MTQTQDVYIINFEATPTDIKFSKTINPVLFDNSVPINLVIGGWDFSLYIKPFIPLGAVYPVPAHVRSPDQFGPNGNDYTGVEQLPAPADVRLGTGYGANGTELTGELNPGSGSSKRRIRNIG